MIGWALVVEALHTLEGSGLIGFRGCGIAIDLNERGKVHTHTHTHNRVL